MQNILNEIMEAYCDCRLDWEEASKRRNLNFRASKPVSRDEAVEIAKAAIPDGYNEFDVDKLKLLPAKSKVTFAREGSVCVYVTPAVEEITKMVADEWHVKWHGTKETRIWWD